MRSQRYPLVYWLLLVAWPIQAQSVELTFFDVGQGDAILIHDPDRCAVLVDAGPLRHGHRITRELQRRGITRLDRLIITHPHLDHFGGVFDLAPRITIDLLLDNGDDSPDWVYFDDFRALRESLPYARLHAGHAWTCGALAFAVLHPPARQGTGMDLNARSLVLRVRLDGLAVLLTGDLSGAGLQGLLTSSAELSAAILKVSHHGAADGTTQALLERVDPDVAIISVGRDNRWGSPAPHLVRTLHSRGIDVYRTDVHGSIRIIVEGDHYRVVTQ